ncbi:hypothetical protein [Halobaculum sp. MBLA0143]|uniref:hypothetical protein n=1 Tax=Halobaculum sp. MBLA0143 TaxID=3079933 RepID=UPI0035247BE0
MSYYDAVADLPFVVESVALERRSRDTSSGFERVTTTVSLHGPGDRGRGEDVCYDTDDHDALFDDPAAGTVAVGFDELVGEWTVDEFSDRLAEIDLFPTHEPERAAAHHYRRWAFESAALDLALRRADTSLGEQLGLTPEPVRFVASMRLGDPPTTERVDTTTDHAPGVELKLDPTSDWTPALIDALPADRVRVVDFKGHYDGTVVDQEPDPELYERVLTAFPDAVVEDPAVVPETEALLADEADRIAWDAPVESLADLREAPFESAWLNVKPSRFGSLESLFETLAWADSEGVELYGGGQFELGVGRSHVQTLASLLYPTGPNDVAPAAYNGETVPERLPASPLAPSSGALGLDF